MCWRVEYRNAWKWQMKFIIITIISMSLKVNLAQITFSPMMGWGGDERISKIALKVFFPIILSMFHLLWAHSGFISWLSFPSISILKFFFQDFTSQLLLLGVLLGVRCKQAFTFQILCLNDWEAVEVPAPLPLSAHLFKSLLQSLCCCPALVITHTFSFPVVVIGEWRGLELLNSWGRIHLRLGLHFKIVSGWSKLAGWGCFCLPASFCLSCFQLCYIPQ